HYLYRLCTLFLKIAFFNLVLFREISHLCLQGFISSTGRTFCDMRRHVLIQILLTSKYTLVGLIKTTLSFSLLFLTFLSTTAQRNNVDQLKKLSIEDLMTIEVTSVSKSPQKLTEVASAI